MDVNLGSRRERKRQAARQKILYETIELINQHGVAGTRIETICERAELTRRTFYSHFPSKDALVAAILEEHVQAKLGALEEQREQCEAGGEPCSYLEAHIRATDSLLTCDCANREVGVALIAAVSVLVAASPALA